MGVATTVSIAHDEVEKYLLNVDHPQGGPKAKFLIASGFSPDRPRELTDALHAQLTDPQTKRSGRPHPKGFGIVVEAHGLLPTPSGRSVLVKTVWNQATGSRQIDFVTAVPA